MSWLSRILAPREARSLSGGWLTYNTASGSTPAPDSLAATHRCISLISNDLASLAIDVGADAPLDLSSRWHSAFELRRLLQSDALRYGNAFAFIARQGDEIAELVYVAPTRVQLIQTRADYEFTIDGVGVEYPDLLHIRALPNGNPLWGVSPLRQCATAFTLAATQDLTGVEAMKNAGLGKVAIVHPASMSVEAKKALKEAYKREHVGAGNISSPLVLSEGIKVDKISDPFGAAGWLDSRRFSVSEIGRAFGVPGQLMFSVDGGTLTSVYEAYRTYIDGCLSHWARTWTAEITRKLLPPGRAASMQTDSLIRAGMSDLAQSWATLVAAGIATRNEARAAHALAPLAGLDTPTMRLDTAETV